MHRIVHRAWRKRGGILLASRTSDILDEQYVHAGRKQTNKKER